MNTKSLVVLAFFLFPRALTGSQIEARKDTLLVQNLGEVVISATKQSESLLQAPVSVEKLNLQAIHQSAQPGFFESLQSLKGIQFITPSLGFRVLNSRGFGHTTNVRFVQLVDGIDNQAPHIGAPIGNSLGPTDLDILSVEIVPGSASSLFGMNAINGIANFITKNPFEFPGFSFNQKTGINHVRSQDSDPAMFAESNLRFAQVWSEKWAIKINGSYQRGTDWVANNLTDLNSTANAGIGLLGLFNPGADLINQYGDESANRRTLLLNGSQYVVSRTGYAEKEIADYGLSNFRGDFGIYFRPKDQSELAYTFRAATQNNLFQRTNRFRLEDYLTQQHALIFQSPQIQLKAYYTTENSGNSYNIRSMAENLDRSFKPDGEWFSNFSNHFKSAEASRLSIPEALNYARKESDRGRLLPGSKEIKQKIEELRDINDWNFGAALRIKTSLFHTEFQQDISHWNVLAKAKIRAMYGLDYRSYKIFPDGNYFINPIEEGENLNYWKTGSFVQATRTFWDEKLKLNTVLRLDKNQYFNPKLNPRIALVYSPNSTQSLRFAYQNGYRFPSIFEGFSNINSGGRKRIGGLPVMSQGIFENSYIQASVTQFQRAVRADVNTAKLPLPEAIERNQNLLAKNSYTYLQPERVRSLEIGFRSKSPNGKLDWDLDIYLNKYQNLIAQLDVSIPKYASAESLGLSFLQNNTQELYRLWTNSKTISRNYGGSAGLHYQFEKDLYFSGNFTFDKLSGTSQGDGLEGGFNTPAWHYNLILGFPLAQARLGFQVNFRQQAAFHWESALASGWVESYSSLDFQMSSKIFKGLGRIKIGATNALNQYYYSYLGGPAIGGYYYSSLTLEL